MKPLSAIVSVKCALLFLPSREMNGEMRHSAGVAHFRRAGHCADVGVSGEGQSGDSGYFPMPEALRQLISAEMIRHFESFHWPSTDVTLSVRISALIEAHLRLLVPKVPTTATFQLCQREIAAARAAR